INNVNSGAAPKIDVIKDCRKMGRIDGQKNCTNDLIVVFTDDITHHANIFLTYAVIITSPLRMAERWRCVVNKLCDTTRQLSEYLCVNHSMVFIEKILLIDIANRAIFFEQRLSKITPCCNALSLILISKSGQCMLYLIRKNETRALVINLHHSELNIFDTCFTTSVEKMRVFVSIASSEST